MNVNVYDNPHSVMIQENRKALKDYVRVVSLHLNIWKRIIGKWRPMVGTPGGWKGLERHVAYF